MPLVPSSTPLTHFRLISFDVYGTLVDWETGIATALLASPHLSSLPSSHPFKTSRKALLKAFGTHERAIQAAHPNMLYSAVLGESYKQLVASLSTSNDSTKETENDDALVAAAAAAFSTSTASWPAFPDTLAALHALSARSTLVPLTNTSNALFAQTCARALAGAPFAATVAACTAEDVGCYKPALANFEYLFARALADFGVPRERILHVAQSLWHDHVPAARLGLESVWVDRGGVMGGEEEGEEVAGARYAWRVRSLGELAEMVEEAFREEGGKGEGV